MFNFKSPFTTFVIQSLIHPITWDPHLFIFEPCIAVSYVVQTFTKFPKIQSQVISGNLKPNESN